MCINGQASSWFREGTPNLTVTLARVVPRRLAMSLRDDLKVFSEPGFYISAILSALLIGGLLAFCGFMVHRIQI
jgi:hypothetical protein